MTLLVSTKMLDRLSQAGLDRLWLGVDGKQALKDHPEMVARKMHVCGLTSRISGSGVLA